MQLYYCPGHLSFAPHVILNEIGVPYTGTRISIENGDTRSPWFRALNPKGKIPVLLDHGEVLTETAAILMYLADLFPQHQLLPPDALGRSRAVEWMNWLTIILTTGISQSLHPHRFTEDVCAQDGVRSCGRHLVSVAYSEIDARLSKSRYALGESFSVIDPILYIYFGWGEKLSLQMQKYENWKIHTCQLRSRKSILRTLDIERDFDAK